MQNGDGLVDTPEKLQAIEDKIKEALEKSLEHIAARRASLSGVNSTNGSRKNSITSSNADIGAVSSRKRNISINSIGGLFHRQASISTVQSATQISKLRIHITYW